MCNFCRKNDIEVRFGTCSWTGTLTLLVFHHIRGRSHSSGDLISPDIHALWHAKFIDPPKDYANQEKYAALYLLVRSTFRLIYRKEHHVLCTWLKTMEKLALAGILFMFVHYRTVNNIDSQLDKILANRHLFPSSLTSNP